MGSRGGGFRAGADLVGSKAFFQKQRGRAASLRQEISGDETISDVTKSELTTELGRLDSGEGLGGEEFKGIIDRAAGTLGEARKGKGKFAGRQIQSKKRALLADRPGRSQTILTR
jgi:hypothetical protein